MGAPLPSASAAAAAAAVLADSDDDVIVILDAGAQYCKVIDRRIRELNIRSEILPLETPASALYSDRIKGVIISGGPNSLADNPDLAQSFDRHILELKPVLGICYGMQLMNVIAGGTMERKTTREDGVFNIDLEPSPLWAGIPSPTPVLLTHGDSVGRISDEYRITARSSDHTEIVVGIAHRSLPLYGVQFHPEVTLTVNGIDIFRNFLIGICHCRRTYTPTCRRQAAIDYIRGAVPADHDVVVLASGGVDSSVVCALLAQALPVERVVAVHVDTGFMRHDESAAVVQALGVLGLRLHLVDARERFASATTTIGRNSDGDDGAPQRTPPLRDVHDPELKRQIIGDCFMAVCDQELRQLGLDADRCILAQGSLRPDLIESGSPSVGKAAQVIKTHHNDTALVRQLRQAGRIIEPLRDYHKDEVRSLGLSLGLSEALVWRQPFPGPGLAIRTICASIPYMPVQLDAIRAQLRQFARADVVADLLPCRTVGVQGDGRSYASLVALRTTQRHPNWSQLMTIARAIPKQVHAVNRVVYVFNDDDIEQPIPFTITPSSLTQIEIDLVRAADRIVNQVLLAHGLLRVLSQVPVIMFPADFGLIGKRSIALRPFVTQDFMTGEAAVPGQHVPEPVLEEIVNRIMNEVKGVARVCLDLTSKPPGTTEWE